MIYLCISEVTFTRQSHSFIIIAHTELAIELYKLTNSTKSDMFSGIRFGQAKIQDGDQISSMANLGLVAGCPLEYSLIWFVARPLA